jgi:hypothetical protein
MGKVDPMPAREGADLLVSFTRLTEGRTTYKFIGKGIDTLQADSGSSGTAHYNGIKYNDPVHTSAKQAKVTTSYSAFD